QCADEKRRVIEAGGLMILGTERHESRRIDNQLRGRAGRQGDPGASRFFLSMDDDLMRIFAGDKMKAAMKTLGMEEDVPIESPMVTRAIERAQKQVEQRNFEIRKHLLEYDDVNNKQRTEIYGLRHGILEELEQKDFVMENGRAILDELVQEHLGAQAGPEAWDLPNFRQQLKHFFGMELSASDDELHAIRLNEVADKLWDPLVERYDAKEEKIGADRMREYERHLLLQIIDAAWKDHLLAMDHLKEGIGLRAYGQKDPLIEYKRESFEMFGHTRARIEEDAVRYLFLLEPMTEEERARQEAQRRAEQEQIFRAASQAKAGVTAKGGVQTVKKAGGKVGRNSPCPCGSGKKYKRCCGA
nr:preprotein translocase subunit SecA [Acidobacteriota bacterium]NIM64091.1 preprotein translocase subunit SecA [Acidobacteriota bacterium]NIO58234.1 preprotein translocase subunit SecA [Acidobacteriota bacterium]NIQ86456.1 preprotein translocase subunit SecA [Acidobacteriota bacterium]NIT10001.1 preprotein translocase subunit SecA [Acidobacteriota bacterium]